MRYEIGDPFEVRRDVPRSVRATVDIAAPPDAVFRALADPRELAAWLGGEALVGETREDSGGSDAADDVTGDASDDATHPALRPRTERTRSGTAPASPAIGRAWRAAVRAPDGRAGSVSGEFVHVDPPRRLESTWRASWTGFLPERVAFELVPIDVGGAIGTRVTVTHARAERRRHATVRTITTAAPTAGVGEDDVWAALLTRLAAYVGATTAVARWGTPSDGDPAHGFDALHRRVVAIHQGESA